MTSLLYTEDTPNAAIHEARKMTQELGFFSILYFY